MKFRNLKEQSSNCSWLGNKTLVPITHWKWHKRSRRWTLATKSQWVREMTLMKRQNLTCPMINRMTLTDILSVINLNLSKKDPLRFNHLPQLSGNRLWWKWPQKSCDKSDLLKSYSQNLYKFGVLTIARSSPRFLFKRKVLEEIDYKVFGNF